MPQAPRPLRATYRLQVHKEFTLENVREIVPYLARFGVSHIYTSPILKARPGSTHGYDVADPKVVNPELGGEDAFRALVKELHAHDLGYVLDIVPNHMGTGSSNPYWEDVLANGRESIYGHWFDIDWESPDPALKGRLLLPVLGDELDAVLGKGELSIGCLEGQQVARLKYFDNSFPLSPETVREIGTEEIEGKQAAGQRRIREILDRQHYSIVSWRRAAKDINYRRFFDINELVALRMEDPSVFEETHARILEWVADGSLDGLRIDHIDGLLDPQGYLDRLRAEVTSRRGKDFPIYVEKILSPGEQLRRSWPVEGTTGYEILNDLEAVMIDDKGFAAIEDAYRKLMRSSGETLTFEQMAIDGKIAILRGSLSPDITRLTRLLVPIAKSAGALVGQGGGAGADAGRSGTGGGPRRGSDGASVDEEALRDGIIELIACLPVYRTYIDGADGTVPDEDAKVLEHAFTRARERGLASTDVLDLLSDVLRPSAPADDPADRAARQLFVRRFQQTSGPATAKGVEDTGLYLYMPLVSRNEVGGSPDRPLDVAIPTLHEANELRAEHWPKNLVCSNTHDTKRSADVRARLDVLAEMPAQWMSSVRRWRMLNKANRVAIGRRSAPDPNTEYLFYQTLLGIWPHDYEAGEYPKPDEMESLHERVEAYMLKAVKEGKSRSNWTDPDEKFETAMKNFINTAFFRSPTFLSDFAQLASRTSRPGLWNALTRTMLHLTVPGVPDIYQGGELFNFALVDPDNRRPVDYEVRREMIEELESREKDDALIEELIGSPDDGRAKMHLFRSVLRARRDRFELFARGGYEPLMAEGAESRHVIAFARTHGKEAAVVVVPRLPAGLSGGEDAPIGMGVWGETTLVLPRPVAGRQWTCAVTGRSIGGGGERGIPIGEILATFPVALLIANHEG